MNEHKPTLTEIAELLTALRDRNVRVEFDAETQVLTFIDTDEQQYTLALPPVLPAIDPGNIDHVLQQIHNASLNYSIVLIQAGAAALGHFETGEVVHHKVIKKYMTRKKQGKSQLKHLNTKGKSRLGSRIRLRNSVVFFEEINATLAAWDVATRSEAILMAVPINLKNLLFSSNVPIPFDKKDPRIKKIPVDIRVPTYKELLHINWIVSRGTLSQSSVNTQA